MTILVIHAPQRQSGKKSFKAVLDDGIGKGYAIGRKHIPKLTSGSKVVLLAKDLELRAEGLLSKPPEPTDKYTPQGIRRYNIYIKGLKKVPYKPEDLNHWGISIIE